MTCKMYSVRFNSYTDREQILLLAKATKNFDKILFYFLENLGKCSIVQYKTTIYLTQMNIKISCVIVTEVLKSSQVCNTFNSGNSSGGRYLRMTATERFYLQNFCKVQYFIINTMLIQKWMKNVSL